MDIFGEPEAAVYQSASADGSSAEEPQLEPLDTLLPANTVAALLACFV